MAAERSLRTLTELYPGTSFVATTSCLTTHLEDDLFRLEVRRLETARNRRAPYVHTSLSCTLNARCPAYSAGMDDLIRSTVQVGGCSGVLLNNVREDFRPLVMTAKHCGSAGLGEHVNTIFSFYYESDNCTDPTDAPVPYTIQGATVVAVGDPTDYRLFELDEEIPASWEVTWSGWDAALVQLDPNPSSITFGHPAGDIKKLMYTDQPYVFNENNVVGYFDVATARGATEDGTSGSPLFDTSTSRAIGIVRSAAVCSFDSCCGFGGVNNRAQLVSTYFGLIVSDGASAVLDPDNTGLLQLDALHQCDPECDSHGECDQPNHCECEDVWEGPICDVCTGSGCDHPGSGTGPFYESPTFVAALAGGIGGGLAIVLTVIILVIVTVCVLRCRKKEKDAKDVRI